MKGIREIEKPKPIQENLGQTLIDAIHSFAKKDLDSVEEIEEKYLSHISDTLLRKSLAETVYGARWIYKLGLVLLVRDEEQLAHTRAQLIDYGSVCEAVLSDMILHGIRQNRMKGERYLYQNPVLLTKKIEWSPTTLEKEIRKRSFNWLIIVAEEEKMIDTALKVKINWLKGQRNKVHLRENVTRSYLNKSHHAFENMSDLFKQTKKWKRLNP